MAVPSKAQLKAELAQLSRRLRPVTDEYLDGYFLIGQRAGGEPANDVSHIMSARRRGQAVEIENLILWYAAEILERRKRNERRRHKRRR